MTPFPKRPESDRPDLERLMLGILHAHGWTEWPDEDTERRIRAWVELNGMTYAAADKLYRAGYAAGLRSKNRPRRS